MPYSRNIAKGTDQSHLFPEADDFTFNGAAGLPLDLYHGADGRGGEAGSVVDPSFLALVSDQMLRTSVIAGRPDLGKPDWRGNSPTRAMTNQEISDVVAWMAAKRVPFPGQPYASAHEPAGR